jgi:hypothetical protein
VTTSSVDPVTNPASVLTPSELAAARAAAASAPPLTPRQRDILSAIFAPALRALRSEQATTQ